MHCIFFCHSNCCIIYFYFFSCKVGEKPEKDPKENSDVPVACDISANIVANALTVICGTLNLLPEEREAIGFDSLLPCHHPAIGKNMKI